MWVRMTWPSSRCDAGGRRYDVIGVSAHTVEEAVRAVKGGADCLGVGARCSPHRPKPTQARRLKATLRDICAAVDVPVVAIGGRQTSPNIMQLAGTGVDGAALVSAIFAADDIEGECRALRKLS